MDDINFTEEEIREQLNKLGYYNVSDARLQEFKRDLEKLVAHERSKGNSLSGYDDTSSTGTESSEPPPPRKLPEDMHVTDGPYRMVPEYRDYREHASGGDDVFYGKENVVGGERHGPTRHHHIIMPRVPLDSDTGPDVSMYSTEDSRVLPADSSADTTSTERRMMKRKVLRRKNGHAEVCDESVTESDTVSEDLDMVSLEARLQQLPLRDHNRPVAGRFEHDDYTSRKDLWPRRPHSARDPPNYRLPEDYVGPKALIRPMTANPHTQNIKKSDPVKKYQQYSQSWGAQRAPGEKSHKDLRWSVREHMLYHDEVVQKKQSRVYVPNSYVIPSDKKRKSLRWQIRNDLAQGIKPPSVFD